MQKGVGNMQHVEQQKQVVKTFTDLHAWQEGHRLDQVHRKEEYVVMLHIEHTMLQENGVFL